MTTGPVVLILAPAELSQYLFPIKVIELFDVGPEEMAPRSVVPLLCPTTKP